MFKLFKAENGMNIVGQGLKIILFTVPSVLLVVFLSFWSPDLVGLHFPSFIQIPLGVVLFVPGLLLWISAILQLLNGFPKGKLVTTGAYGVCRNPIYSSVAILLLPGISLLTGNWTYLIVSVFLCLGVNILIRKEEQKLGQVFGDEYTAYKRKVSRIIPLLRPFNGK